MDSGYGQRCWKKPLHSSEGPKRLEVHFQFAEKLEVPFRGLLRSWKIICSLHTPQNTTRRHTGLHPEVLCGPSHRSTHQCLSRNGSPKNIEVQLYIFSLPKIKKYTNAGHKPLPPYLKNLIFFIVVLRKFRSQKEMVLQHKLIHVYSEGNDMQ